MKNMNRKILIITIAVLVTGLIWNMINISSMNSVGKSRALLESEEDTVTAVIHSEEGELPGKYIFIDRAISEQKEYNKRLVETLGRQFTDSVFKLPASFRPSSNESPKVFFNEKSDDVKIDLIKKKDIYGFDFNAPLEFGDADEQTIIEASSMLYLMFRVIDEAIESGLKSLEQIRQHPKELEISPENGFEFEIYRITLTLKGKPKKIFKFVEQFQRVEPGKDMKQKVFVSNVNVFKNERVVALEADFSLVAYKGKSKSFKKKQSTNNRHKKGKTPGKKQKAAQGVPLGI